MITLGIDLGANGGALVVVDARHRPPAILQAVAWSISHRKHGFNAEYLHQAVSKMVSDKVRIRGTHPLASYIVEPYDDGGSFAVIMPMRIAP